MPPEFDGTIAPMTNQPKFTPGPWEIANEVGLCVSAMRGVVCRMIRQGWILDTGEIVGNAHLIAAAPDLFTALTALVAAVERDDNPRDEGHFSDSDEMKTARAALAKACLDRFAPTKPN